MHTLGTIAELLSARLNSGNPETRITGLASLSGAGSGDLSVYLHRRFQNDMRNTDASAVIVDQQLADDIVGTSLVVGDSSLAFAELLELFDSRSKNTGRVAPSATIAESAIIHPSVSIGPGAVIGKDVTIGAYSRIDANAIIEEGCTLGVGVRIGAGSVIGSDGFGFVWDVDHYRRLTHLGSVIIEDNVEIGANVTIDRGTLGVTRICRGSKLDNLIQVAHNVEIGPHTVIAAQVGIAGSARIGSRVQIGGQAGVSDHVTLGDNTIVGSQSGVMKSVSGGVITGHPARPVVQKRRAEAALMQVARMRKEYALLQSRVAELEEAAGRE